MTGQAIMEAWTRLFGGDDRNVATPPPPDAPATLPLAVVALLAVAGLWLWSHA